ncbi:hypothetical protein G7048_10925 [Diaphorobacter sp. HDW4B]|nr:hypothetical protein [Diaphorobacter sp. HDW4B]QIL70829.1 hypothetical protein G7048_10925 [Diaphorobacter sp. HDW4B]
MTVAVAVYVSTAPAGRVWTPRQAVGVDVAPATTNWQFSAVGAVNALLGQRSAKVPLVALTPVLVTVTV